MTTPINKSPSVQWYPDKWLADTRRLSWKTKGLYCDLLNVIWMQFQHSCSIPDNDLFIASELGCTIEEWQVARAEIMLEHRPLMELQTNRLFSNGLYKEYVKQQLRREHLRENGLKGGRPITKRLFLEKPNESRTKADESLSSPSPTPSPSLIDTGSGEDRVISDNEIQNPDRDPIKLTGLITGEKDINGFFHKALAVLGSEKYRDVLGLFHSEMKSGEKIRNKGACLTAKLKKFMPKNAI